MTAQQTIDAYGARFRDAVYSAFALGERCGKTGFGAGTIEESARRRRMGMR